MTFRPERPALGSNWPRARLFALGFAVAALVAGILLATLTPPGPNAPAASATIAQPHTVYDRAAVRVQKLWEKVRIRAGDTLARILTSRGHDAAVVHEIVQSGPGGKALGDLRAGTTIQVGTNADGSLAEISYTPDPYRIVSVKRNASGSFESEVLEKPVITVSRFAEGVITDSLFASGKQAGVSDNVILEMADVFSYDIDFALEVRQGDQFRVVYEEKLVDGTKVRDGDVLAAEFTNNGKKYQAVRFQPSTGKAGYYTPDGLALRKAFLRTPVDFARISSGFALRRMHPVLHTLRAHKGVDYAAARGTAVRATAEGRIEYAGNKGGYGRVVILQHGRGQSTLYAHLNGFAKGVRAGARVSQGQIIGYVGSTGLASGPHLHYEFRVNGTHVDPLKVKTTQAEPIASMDRAAFLSESSRLLAMLDGMSGRTSIAQHSVSDASFGRSGRL